MSHAQEAVLNGVVIPERRRHPRYICALPVEIRFPGIDFPSLGETSDVSLCGCYIRTSFNMTVGTEVELKLWVGNTGVQTKAIVRTSDPGLGNGIEFLELDTNGQQVLSAYFARLDSCPPGPAKDLLRDPLLV